MNRLATTPKLLIVDDDPIETEVLRRAVGASFVVDGARTIAEGLELLESSTALVLLDHHLQSDNGIESIGRFKRLGASVILYSGIPASEIEQSAKQAGADSFLCKHETDGEKLKTALRAAMARRPS